jgi:hypothetical protein
LLSDRKRIIDLYTEIPDRTFLLPLSISNVWNRTQGPPLLLTRFRPNAAY